MRIILLVLALGALLLGCLLTAIGAFLLTDPNELMFGLPYIFLLPGIPLLILGSLGLWLSHRLTRSHANPQGDPYD
ncbi:MAG: hypothetical protein BWY57_00098 [Betaproteobacteria bacterium ADurb.Bin341]|nr:MAG: hypothetical protein BWY57_00098 [Betaproteobacteria bacterium ADurb.Bin341]